MDVRQFESRKQDHLRLALDSSNQSTASTGLERIRLRHEALPELDFSDVQLEAPLWGRPHPTPLYIPGMTAGHVEGQKLNETLAEAACNRGWVLGVGSQRRELTSPGLEGLGEWVTLRRRFPQLKTVGNLGLSQVIKTEPTRVLALAHELGACALAVHLNALQEALQPEGTPQFSGGLRALENLAAHAAKVSLPIVAKETGCGFSAATLRRLAATGVRAVDVSGRGGTHWGRIEGRRAPDRSIQSVAAEAFADWGESTVDSLVAARNTLPAGVEVWASGGIRNGLDAAKAIALGAQRVGFARSALEAAILGGHALDRWMQQVEFELRVALFCTGSRSPEALRENPEKWTWASVS